MFLNIRRPSGAKADNLTSREVFTAMPELEWASVLDRQSTFQAFVNNRSGAGACSGQRAVAGTMTGNLNGDAGGWEDLIEGRNVSYWVLLQNLQHILASAPHLIHEVADMLTDEALIRRANVTPFQFLAVVEALEKEPPPGALRVIAALSDAADIALVNVPKLNGRTLVALDGAMAGRFLQTASLFAAVMAKANGADVFLLGEQAKPTLLDLHESTLLLARRLESHGYATGANFRGLFHSAGPVCDRLVILSDRQGWISECLTTAEFAQWKQRSGGDPKVFSFNLSNCGSQEFSESEEHRIAVWSDKALEVMQFFESG